MKHLPNILSSLRILLTIPLLWLKPFKLPFMVIYTVAGVTDMIDGPLARKYDITSQFGATLDGFADVLLVLVVLFRLIPLIEFSNWVGAWIFIVIAMKFLASLIGYIRHKEIILLHTYANKFFIFALFLFPIFYSFMEADTVLAGLLIIATLAFTEDIYINATSKEVDLDHKGIFFHKQ